MNSIRKTLNKNRNKKKKDASISLHKPIRGNSHLSDNIFIKIKRIMKNLLARSLILLIYKYKLFLNKWEAFP